MTMLSPASSLPDLVAANRARGVLKADFQRVGVRTEPGHAFETGGYRLRFPRQHGDRFCEGVIVNTGGGMAGGDHVVFSFAAGPDSAVTLTTTAAEKIYRSDGAATRLNVDLVAATSATLEWLPQETILFDGARLQRQFGATLAMDASLLVCETLVFGRLAMGEVLRRGSIRDRWRIRHGSGLVYAEDLRLEGDIAATLDRPALGNGARASATLLLVSPDAESRLAAVRAVLEAPGALFSAEVAAGASAFNGLLLVRALSRSPERLRTAIVALLAAVRGRPLPRLWS